MIGRAVWLWLAVALGIGFGLFQLKYQVQGLEEKLARINRQILESEESIHVLKAEWSYLNQPDRIEALARKHLGLLPLGGKQYGALEDLPMRGDAAVGAPAPGQPEASAPSAAPAPLPAERPILLHKGGVTLAREVR